ncbi:MAG: metal-dependent hydrolase [Gammaproteobacteria bacterium]
MANFNTHLFVASAAGATLAAAGIKAQVFGIADAPLFFTLVLAGGILPDIDADRSRPAKLLFELLAALCAVGTILTLQGRFPLEKLLPLGGAAYLLIRYPLAAAFYALTLHRGIIHSLLAAAFFTLLLVWGGHRLLDWPPRRAWLGGACLGTGFIVHLVLDELYSVDLSNKRMKKSFGTALKLYHYDNLLLSLLMAACTWLLYHLAPPAQTLLQLLRTAHWDELLRSLGLTA